ncbi:hypothetical protein KRM28CT15_38470 [Krasilnikovia sp. M28-CT-15]
MTSLALLGWVGPSGPAAIAVIRATVVAMNTERVFAAVAPPHAQVEPTRWQTQPIVPTANTPAPEAAV